MKVKVCAIDNLKEAKEVVRCGADAIGLLVDVSEAPEHKRLLKEEAKRIINGLPKNIWTFVLTDSKDYKKIISICKELKCTHVQIVEDLSNEELDEIKRSLPDLKIVKAICVTDNSAISKAISYSKVSDYILLDSRIKGQRGGTGRTHDWNISKEIVKAVDKPVFLAGGLNSENVKEAILKVRPFGVDAATKLENAFGRKDFFKVKNFIEAAKSV